MNIKKLGYTLSEILLVLALIGSLATMTLTNIGASVQQRARLSEFRAAYAKMENAIHTLTLDEGRIYGCYLKPSDAFVTEYGLKLPANAYSYATVTECQALTTAFARVMGVVRTCETNPVDEGCLPANYVKSTSYFKDVTKYKAYVLDNGMIMFTDEGTMVGLQRFAVDVNGRKGPNKWGMDVFPFGIYVKEGISLNNHFYPKVVGFLPLPSAEESSIIPEGSNTTKTTTQLLKESMGKK